MPKTEISDYDETDAGNTDISGIVLSDATFIDALDNIARAQMGALKRWFKSSLFRLRDSTDQTKLLAFDLSGLTTATTRTITMPDADGTLALVGNVSIKGHIFGLTIAPNSTDATNDIDISPGEAASASTAPSLMALASTLTKRADAVWAAGTNQGGRFHAALADGTLNWYVIKNPTTGVVDAGFSDNAVDPTGGTNYPSGFTLYRRIGSILRSGGAILPFYQNPSNPDEFRWLSPPTDIASTNPGTSAVTRNLTMPQGPSLSADLVVQLLNGTNAILAVLISPLAVADVTPTNAINTLIAVASALGINVSVAVSIHAGTSGQVRSRLSASGAADQLRITTLGWTDARGRY